MKKILLVILVVALAAPAVGFKDDDKTKVMPRMPNGGGYCAPHNGLCPDYWIINPYPVGPSHWHYPCTEQGVLPPNIHNVEWENAGGECGRLLISFDEGDFTTVNCYCGIM